MLGKLILRAAPTPPSPSKPKLSVPLVAMPGPLLVVLLEEKMDAFDTLPALLPTAISVLLAEKLTSLMPLNPDALMKLSTGL